MQQLIDERVQEFEAVADALSGGVVPAGEEIVQPQTHVRAGITTNKGRGQSKVRRRMAAASRRRNRAA